MSRLRLFFAQKWVTHGLTGLVAGAGGLCFSVAGGQLAGLVSGGVKSTWLQWLILIAFGIASVGLLGYLVPRLQRAFAPRFPELKADQFSTHIRPRPALITLVSLPKPPATSGNPHARGNPAETAILYHLRHPGGGDSRLKHCWLLYTPAAESEFDNLSKTYSSETLQCHPVLLHPDAASDPHLTYTEVLKACRTAHAYGLGSDQIIADATGGTVPMSIGMALACREIDLALEYISSPWEHGQPDFDHAEMVEIDMSDSGTQGEVRAQHPVEPDDKPVSVAVPAGDNTSATS